MYGIGQLPEGVKSAAFGFFLLFYYNQVLGLPGSLAGLALFIALGFDAVTDPLVGSWSDFSRNRLGRRHPFMYIAAIPFAIAFVCLFMPPDGLSEIGLFFWMLVFAVLTRTAMTLYHVPYLSLGAELSSDYDERTLLAALRNVFQLLGMFAVLIGGNMLFFQATEEYANGQLNPSVYAPFALACLPLMVVGVWVAAIGTHSEIGRLHQPAIGDRPAILKAALGDVMTAFRIPAFVAVVCASVVFSVNQGMIQALHLYMATYFFELTPGQVTLLFGGAITGIVVGSLLSRPVSSLIREKRNVFILGSAWYAFFTSVVIILRLLGLLPPNEDPIVAVLYISSGCISALGLGVAIPMIGSLIADVTDEHQLRHGTRQEGIYYAAASFAGKAVGGIGPILAGVIIDAAGIAPGSSPQEVAPEAIERFGWATGPSVVVLSAISIIAVLFYDISRKRHTEILEQLQARAE